MWLTKHLPPAEIPITSRKRPRRRQDFHSIPCRELIFIVIVQQLPTGTVIIIIIIIMWPPPQEPVNKVRFMA